MDVRIGQKWRSRFVGVVTVVAVSSRSVWVEQPDGKHKEIDRAAFDGREMVFCWTHE